MVNAANKCYCSFALPVLSFNSTVVQEKGG